MRVHIIVVMLVSIFSSDASEIPIKLSKEDKQAAVVGIITTQPHSNPSDICPQGENKFGREAGNRCCCCTLKPDACGCCGIPCCKC